MQTKIRLATLLLISCLVLSLGGVSAQEIKGFTMSPTGRIVELDPINSRQHSIMITNNEDIPVLIETEVFETKNNTEILESPNEQISSIWIEFQTENSFNLEPQETKEIIYTINLPALLPQTLLQSTIFLNVNTYNDSSDSYSFLIKIPHLINFIPIKESNSTLNSIEILNQPSSQTFNNSNSIKFLIQNEDTVDSFTKPIVYFQVLNLDSKPIYSKILNEGAANLVNKDSQEFEESFSIPYDFLNDLGTYTIEIMVVDSISNSRQVIKTSFTNIPYYYFLIAVCLIGILFIIRKRLATKKK